MLLKNVTVSSILNNEKNKKLWEKLTSDFISKMKKTHKLSDDKVTKLKKVFMDKEVLKKAIADFKEIHQAGQSGGAKKKSRRRKKKKHVKKTKRRQRGGDLTQDILIYMGIFSTCLLGVAVWSTLEWGGRHAYNLVRNAVVDHRLRRGDEMEVDGNYSEEEYQEEEKRGE